MKKNKLYLIIGGVMLFIFLAAYYTLISLSISDGFYIFNWNDIKFECYHEGSTFSYGENDFTDGSIYASNQPASVNKLSSYNANVNNNLNLIILSKVIDIGYPVNKNVICKSDIELNNVKEIKLSMTGSLSAGGCFETGGSGTIIISGLSISNNYKTDSCLPTPVSKNFYDVSIKKLNNEWLISDASNGYQIKKSLNDISFEVGSNSNGHGKTGTITSSLEIQNIDIICDDNYVLNNNICEKIPELECTSNSDCNQEVCFGQLCVNNICIQNEPTIIPPENCENYIFLDYPECEYKCNDLNKNNNNIYYYLGGTVSIITLILLFRKKIFR